MSNAKRKRTFLDLFQAKNPVLKAKYVVGSDEEPAEVRIENKIEDQPDPKGLSSLEKLCSNEKLKDFLEFYRQYDGFSLATTADTKNTVPKPLLRQWPVSELTKVTEQYLPNGKWAWTIDLNKTKTLYRGNQNWLVFA